MNLPDDERVLKVAEEFLTREGYGNYELESIVTVDKPDITTIIANIGSMKLSLEVDNKSLKIINSERISL